MNEGREIDRAMTVRAARVYNEVQRICFEADFKQGRAFTTHPACDPVNEIYYYDFCERRIKEHR